MSTNGGVLQVETVTVDVTNLSNAGHHVWDPGANTLVDDPESVTVTGQEDPTCHIKWDSLKGDRFHVVNVSDATDVTAGTDIGEVELRVEGRR